MEFDAAFPPLLSYMETDNTKVSNLLFVLTNPIALSIQRIFDQLY